MYIDVEYTEVGTGRIKYCSVLSCMVWGRVYTREVKWLYYIHSIRMEMQRMYKFVQGQEYRS